MAEKLTLDKALGPQNRGMEIPKEVEAALTPREVKDLHEFRMDVVDKIAPGAGLQFTEDSIAPWCNDRAIKLNLGDYREFPAYGWINIGHSTDGKKQFNIDLQKLVLSPYTVDFIYAPFVLEKVENPVAALRAWRAGLKQSGFVAVVIEDLDKLLRAGRKFERARFNLGQLKKMLAEAGYSKVYEINFNMFDLAGDDPGYSGCFAVR